MIVDFHTHIFPDAIAEKAVGSLRDRAHIPAYADGSRAGLLANMKRAGITKSIVLPVVTSPRQFRSITEFAARINDLGNGLESFGGVHPMSEHWEAGLAELHDRGFRGIKLHPDYQGVFVDDEKTVRIVRRAAEYGMVVVFHAGLDLGLPAPIHCTPERAARLIDQIPNGAGLVFAHCGGSHMADEVLRHLTGKNVYFDLSFDLVREPAETVLQIIRAHGANRCLFATDSPWSDPEESVAALRALPLSSEEQNAIFSGNALCLLGDR